MPRKNALTHETGKAKNKTGAVTHMFLAGRYLTVNKNGRIRKKNKMMK